MNTEQVNNYSWSQDLEASRDLTRSEKCGFAIILGWYEKWRISQSLPACRETAAAFWKLKVKAKEREDWQLDQWAEAFRWHLNWLRFAKVEGRETRTLEERVRDAVDRAGGRRGLARRTRETYAGWVGRFARMHRLGGETLVAHRLHLLRSCGGRYSVPARPGRAAGANARLQPG